jgi:hypothetical protein
MENLGSIQQKEVQMIEISHSYGFHVANLSLQHDDPPYTIIDSRH